MLLIKSCVGAVVKLCDFSFFQLGIHIVIISSSQNSSWNFWYRNGSQTTTQTDTHAFASKYMSHYGTWKNLEQKKRPVLFYHTFTDWNTQAKLKKKYVWIKIFLFKKNLGLRTKICMCVKLLLFQLLFVPTSFMTADGHSCGGGTNSLYLDPQLSIPMLGVCVWMLKLGVLKKGKADFACSTGWVGSDAGFSIFCGALKDEAIIVLFF